MGRANFGPYLNEQHRGILQIPMINDKYVENVEVSMFEFDKNFMSTYERSQTSEDGQKGGHHQIYEFELDIQNVVDDTYLELPGFEKGQFFLNGRNIGRYWNSQGPQLSFYGTIFERERQYFKIFKIFF